MSRLAGKVVVVTGAAQGQGAAEARLLAAEEATVVATDVQPEPAEDLAGIAYRQLDVTDAAGWAATVASAVRAFGDITVLVNNAGIMTRAATIEDTHLSDWNRAFAVNSTGPFLGIRAVVPSMRRAGGGAIVNVVSTMGNVGTPMFSAYTASKWAVRGLTRSAALELGRDRIRVNSIHPGVVSTPFIHAPAAGADSAIGDHYSPDAFAVPRLALAQEVTGLLLFLTSPAAAFATGSEYVLDGGMLLGPALAHPSPDSSAPVLADA